jgi:hypothetical protein
MRALGAIYADFKTLTFTRHHGLSMETPHSKRDDNLVGRGNLDQIYYGFSWKIRDKSVPLRLLTLAASSCLNDLGRAIGLPERLG